MSEIKLPKDWKWVKLNEICDKVSLNKIKIKQKQYLPEGKYPVIDQGQDLIGGYFNDEKLIVPNEPPYIIFGDHTKIKKFINFKFIPGADGVKVLKPKEIIEPKFLFYSLFTIKIEDKGYARHFQLLEKELFPLPTLETQQAIVSKIEELFSELDKGIEDLKTSQQQLKTYRQSVLKYAFEGKLTNNNVKEGVLPKGWKVVKMSDVIKLSSLKHKPEKVEDLFYIGLEHIEKHSGKLKPTVGIEKIKTVKNKFLKGDILYGKLRPNLNKVYLSKEEGVCSTDILVLKLAENCLGKYLHQIMISTHFVNEMSENTSGVNLPRVSTKFIMNYEIPLPTVEEQNFIILEIESRLSVADKMEESIAQSLLQAEALRQSILKKAFSGELV